MEIELADGNKAYKVQSGRGKPERLRHNGVCAFSTATTAYIIIAVEFCERLAYYGLGGSLVLFFQRVMNMQNADADVNFSAWSAMCYITPLIGGYMADVYQARYQTILFFATIYLVGLVLAVIGAIPGNSYPALVFFALYTIALGTGGIKPNVSTLGADQFDDRIESERRQKESFFSWFYFSINVGAFFAYTIVSYICQFGLGGDHGGEEWGFFYGYLIPCCSMAMGVLLFMAGNHLFGYEDAKNTRIGAGVSGQVRTGSEVDDIPPPRSTGAAREQGNRSMRLSVIEDEVASTRSQRALSADSQSGATSQDSHESDSSGSSTDSTGYLFSEAISPKVMLGILGQSVYLYLQSKLPNSWQQPLTSPRIERRQLQGHQEFRLKHGTTSGSHRFAKDTNLAGGAVLTTQENPLSQPYEQEVCVDGPDPAPEDDGKGEGQQRDQEEAGVAAPQPPGVPVQVLDWACIDYERGGRYSRRQVAASKLVTRLLPFLGVFVMFWTIYSQMSVGFQNQGCQMNLNLSGQADDGRGGELPIAALQLFDTLAIMIVVPLLDQVVYPYIRERYKWNPPLLLRMNLGFVLCVVAMLLAGIVEAARKVNTPRHAFGEGGYNNPVALDNISPCVNAVEYNPSAYETYWQFQRYSDGKANSYMHTEGYDPTTGPPSHCWQTCDYTWLYPSNIEYSRPDDVLKLNTSCIACDNVPQKSSMSVLWQIPQFFLIGTAEVLSSVSSMEFFYSQTPASFRSVMSSFSLSTTAMGSLLVIPLVYIVNANPRQKWVTADLDDGHLDWFFYLLATLMLVNIAVLHKISGGYQYLDDKAIEDRIRNA